MKLKDNSCPENIGLTDDQLYNYTLYVIYVLIHSFYSTIRTQHLPFSVHFQKVEIKIT